MGLLDDAIREHLDLKRRRGADPAEIERAEQDALGPVRRGPEGSDEAEMEQLPADAEPFDYDQEDERDWQPAERESTAAEDYEPEEPRDSGGPSDAEDPLDAATAAHPAPEPYAAPQADQPDAVSSDTGRDDDAPPPRDRAPERPRPATEPDGDTAEFDAALEDEELGVAGDDVLEETPEFLQDTPDHDRLWFEQRPPKDFDFDG
jgi:hypothetical protein